MKEYKTYYEGNLRECKVFFSVGELADGELSQCSVLFTENNYRAYHDLKDKSLHQV